MESWLLAQKAQIASIEAEIQAMIAENKLAEYNKEKPTFEHAHFMDKARQLAGIYIDLMNNR